eukprot:TRINITY_DN18850_c0_g1_i2.p2 TRINITY_DN18850_c0_g1~~TRINITY_DN18850_c0_g1_i2.p2  ORF type:complete len:115 (+),score=14.61 TRINITY_DN18850_c0_g1_i2:128-472(+)
MEHGGKIKEQSLWQTITTIFEEKHDSFSIEDEDELKYIVVKYDEELNLTYLKVATKKNQYREWPLPKAGQKFKIYFNCSEDIKFQGFCGGLFGNYLRCISFIYHAGKPRLSQIL